MLVIAFFVLSLCLVVMVGACGHPPLLLHSLFRVCQPCLSQTLVLFPFCRFVLFGFNIYGGTTVARRVSESHALIQPIIVPGFLATLPRQWARFLVSALVGWAPSYQFCNKVYQHVD